MDNIRKGSIIYGGMVKGRRKFLIINIIVTILYLLYITFEMNYIVGKLHGPYGLDNEKFLSDTDNIVISEVIEMKKREDKSIQNFALPATSYMDGRKYRFNAKFDSFENIGIKYTSPVTDPTTGDIIDYPLYSVVLGKIGDEKVVILLRGDEIPESGSALEGIFTQHSKIVLSDISKVTAPNGEIALNEYVFDTRGIEMGSENFTIGFFFIGLALLIYLYCRVIRYYINPYAHPAYKQLYKYGELAEVVEDIENQFETEQIYRDNKELVTTDWIMTKDVFKNKVVKNHRTRGRYS